MGLLLPDGGVEHDLEDNFADSRGAGLLVALHPVAWGPRVWLCSGEMNLQQGLTVAIAVPQDWRARGTSRYCNNRDRAEHLTGFPA